jgi:hypothetical protein
MGVVRCCGADARATRDYGRMRGHAGARERECMCEAVGACDAQLH